MSSPHLERKLKETLGEDAGEELAAVTERVDGIRDDIASLQQELRAVELRLEALISKHDELLKAVLAVVQGLESKNEELVKAVHAVDKRIEEKHAQLLMWSLGFWVAAVGAIAALAGVLRA
jgi:hypothetical protein